jgi:hypothetical protein
MPRTKANLQENKYVTAAVLRKVATIMIPFYRKVAYSGKFSDKWAKSVREAELADMESMLRSVISEQPILSLATNGIGYFIDYPFPKPIYAYTNATSLRPGTTQFTFNSSIHRAIAKAVLPLYTNIARNQQFTALIVKAIRTQNKQLVDLLIRSAIPTPRLVSIEIRYSGFFLGFKYPSSKYVYYNELFREGVL